MLSVCCIGEVVGVQNVAVWWDCLAWVFVVGLGIVGE